MVLAVLRCGGGNSSFYAVPSPETAGTWVEKTPPAFLFNVKAYGLLTGHHVDAARLPDPLRKVLPAAMRNKRAGRIPNVSIPEDARAWAFEAMQEAFEPLRQADKLGYVLFQLAPWMKFGDDVLEYLGRIPEALPDTVIAGEFRNHSWFGPRTHETLQFLAQHGLAYVSIDGPRARAAVPSLPALTAPTAVFRLHGRNFQLAQPGTGEITDCCPEVRLPVLHQAACGTRDLLQFLGRNGLTWR